MVRKLSRGIAASSVGSKKPCSGMACSPTRARQLRRRWAAQEAARQLPPKFMSRVHFSLFEPTHGWDGRAAAADGSGRRRRAAGAGSRTSRRPATVPATTIQKIATQNVTRAPDASRVRIARKSALRRGEFSLGSAAACREARASRRRRLYLRPCQRVSATTKRTPTAARRFPGVKLRGVSSAAGRARTGSYRSSAAPLGPRRFRRSCQRRRRALRRRQRRASRRRYHRPYPLVRAARRPSSAGTTC